MTETAEKADGLNQYPTEQLKLDPNNVNWTLHKMIQMTKLKQ